MLETRHGAETGDDGPWRARFDRLVLRHGLRRCTASALRSACSGRLTLQPTRKQRGQTHAAGFAAQMPEAQKRALADILVQNDGSEEELALEVDRLYQRLRAEAVRTTP